MFTGMKTQLSAPLFISLILLSSNIANAKNESKEREVSEFLAPADSPAAPRGDMFLELNVSGGTTLDVGTANGWYGRLGGTMLFRDFPWHDGFFWGFGFGTEFWHNREATGLPDGYVVGVLGWRLSQLDARIEPGIDEIVFDERRDHLGFSFITPRAGLSVGLRFGRLRVAVDSKIQYRWAWSIPDTAQLLTGLRLDFMSESMSESM